METNGVVIFHQTFLSLVAYRQQVVRPGNNTVCQSCSDCHVPRFVGICGFTLVLTARMEKCLFCLQDLDNFTIRLA